MQLRPCLRFAQCLPGLALAAAAWLTSPSLFAQGFPSPGPEHEHLKRFAGQWVATVKPMGGDESKGTMSVKMECGGLWAITDFQGEFAGQKFQGRGMDGYDADKKKYVSVWVDSMSTKPLLFEGTMDAQTKTLTMTGEGPGPDGKPMKYKNQTVFIDDDHQRLTMSVVGDDGAAMPMMTIEYVRKK